MSGSNTVPSVAAFKLVQNVSLNHAMTDVLTMLKSPKKTRKIWPKARPGGILDQEIPPMRVSSGLGLVPQQVSRARATLACAIRRVIKGAGFQAQTATADAPIQRVPQTLEP